MFDLGLTILKQVNHTRVPSRTFAGPNSCNGRVVRMRKRAAVMDVWRVVRKVGLALTRYCVIVQEKKEKSTLESWLGPMAVNLRDLMHINLLYNATSTTPTAIVSE